MIKIEESWAYRNKVRLDFIRPGKPVENAYIESFNGRMRDECVNVNEFDSLRQAQDLIEAWREDYNDNRPHGSLGDLTPTEFRNRRPESYNRLDPGDLPEKCSKFWGDVKMKFLQSTILFLALLITACSPKDGADPTAPDQHTIEITNKFNSLVTLSNHGDKKSLIELFQSSLDDRLGVANQEIAQSVLDEILYKNPEFWILTISKTGPEKYKWHGLVGDADLPSNLTWEQFYSKILASVIKAENSKDADEKDLGKSMHKKLLEKWGTPRH
jgi:hypothetical protein